MAHGPPIAEASATGGQKPVTSLEVLKRYRDFRLIWAGNFAAQSVQWLQMLTIGWLVLHLTAGNALLTGTVVGIRALPVLLVGPWAGVLADRMDRRKLVMISQAAMALVACGFAFLVLATDLDSDPVSGPLRWWHPFVYMIFSGIAHAIIQPVRQAMVANTVPRQALTAAFALNGMVYPFTRILAPAVGGVLIATLGFKVNFFLETVAYLGIVLSLLPAKLPYRTDAPRQRESALKSLVDGIRYVGREPENRTNHSAGVHTQLCFPSRWPSSFRSSPPRYWGGTLTQAACWLPPSEWEEYVRR